jgi:hypothetical protein
MEIIESTDGYVEVKDFVDTDGNPTTFIKVIQDVEAYKIKLQRDIEMLTQEAEMTTHEIRMGYDMAKNAEQRKLEIEEKIAYISSMLVSINDKQGSKR